MALLPRWPRASVPVERLAGAGLVIVAWWLHDGHGRSTPGYPWSGGMFVLLGLAALLRPSARWRDAGRAARVRTVILFVGAFVCGVAWIVDAWTQPPVVP